MEAEETNKKRAEIGKEQAEFSHSGTFLDQEWTRSWHVFKLTSC